MKRTPLVSLAVIVTIFTVVASAAQNNIQISGSDTLILFGQRLAQLYKRRQPVAIEVRGGELSSALETLGKTKDHIVQSQKGGAPGGGGNFISLPVAVEGIVVYVNQSNPISELNIGQVRSIFLGEITNWKALGGKNESIALFAGESSTGTLAYFQDAILKGAEPYPFWGKSTTKELIEAVGQQGNAIGYASIGQGAGVKAVRIRLGKTSHGIEPTPDNIRARTYPISRYVYWYLPTAQSEALKAFCAWTLSPEGQLAVESVGFQPLTPNDRSQGLAKLSGPAKAVGGGR